jgi:hypothetical protein
LARALVAKAYHGEILAAELDDAAEPLSGICEDLPVISHSGI